MFSINRSALTGICVSSSSNVAAIDVVASDGFLPVIPSPFEQGNLEDAHMGMVFVKSGACPCLIEGHERPNDYQQLLRGYGQCRRVVMAEREVGPQGMIRHNVRQINEQPAGLGISARNRGTYHPWQSISAVNGNFRSTAKNSRYSALQGRFP